MVTTFKEFPLSSRCQAFYPPRIQIQFFNISRTFSSPEAWNQKYISPPLRTAKLTGKDPLPTRGVFPTPQALFFLKIRRFLFSPMPSLPGYRRPSDSLLGNLPSCNSAIISPFSSPVDPWVTPHPRFIPRTSVPLLRPPISLFFIRIGILSPLPAVRGALLTLPPHPIRPSVSPFFLEQSWSWCGDWYLSWFLSE